MRPAHRLLAPAAVVCLSTILIASPDAPKSDYVPGVKLAKASDEALKAVANFKVDKALSVEVWAAEPLLANPVAFCFDEKGKLLRRRDVPPTPAASPTPAATCTGSRGPRLPHRGRPGGHVQAGRPEEVRRALREAARARPPARRHHRVRQGRQVHRLPPTASAGAEDGLGAGLLARKGSVYYTCIPDLWVLKDHQGHGQGRRERVAGHRVRRPRRVHRPRPARPAHGAGRQALLQPSATAASTSRPRRASTSSYPDSGGVLRCDPDGSNLEIVHYRPAQPAGAGVRRLRQPVHLDNNCDSGDRARWVQIVEGGDSGWRIGYQYDSDAGLSAGRGTPRRSGTRRNAGPAGLRRAAARALRRRPDRHHPLPRRRPRRQVQGPLLPRATSAASPGGERHLVASASSRRGPASRWSTRTSSSGTSSPTDCEFGAGRRLLRQRLGGRLGPHRQGPHLQGDGRRGHEEPGRRRGEEAARRRVREDAGRKTSPSCSTTRTSSPAGGAVRARRPGRRGRSRRGDSPRSPWTGTADRSPGCTPSGPWA